MFCIFCSLDFFLTYVDYHWVIFHCLPGLPTNVILKCTGLKPPGELNLAELMSSSGRSLRTIPIPPSSGVHQHGLWRLPEFRTPSQSFFIRVTGKDDEGYRFQRLSSVSYTNVIPGKTASSPHIIKSGSHCFYTVFHTSLICRVNFGLRFLPCIDPPLVSMPDVVRGFYMQPVVIRCSVESSVPYKLRFTRDGISVGEEKLYQ